YSSSLRALHSFPTRRSSDLRLSAHLPSGGDLGLSGRLRPHLILTLRSVLRLASLFKIGPLWLGLHFIALGLGAEHLLEIQRLGRSEEHTSELQSRGHLVCRL